MSKVAYLATPGGIHLFLNGKPVTISGEDPRFSKVKAALASSATEEDISAIVFEKEKRLQSFEKEGIVYKDGVVSVDGQPVHGTIASRLIQQLEEGFDVLPLKKFVLNLRKNPSYAVLSNLYDFLEVGKNPLTEDGCFLAYKAVRSDFLDIFSGTIDNSVGCTPEVPRNSVDDDRSKTCSYGLHVCSFGYLPSFADADGHVVICKVNPADVVAIPADYNNTKMRVCRYEVISEHEGYYTHSKSDILGDGPSIRYDIDSPAFVVRGDGKDLEGFQQLSLAAAHAEELVDTSTEFALVEVVNTATGAVVLSIENEDFEGEDDNFDFDFDDEEKGECLTDESDMFEIRGYEESGAQVGPTNYLTSKEDALSFATELLEFDSVDSVKVFDPSDKLIGVFYRS
jgi:hypothetical protein